MSKALLIVVVLVVLVAVWYFYSGQSNASVSTGGGGGSGFGLGSIFGDGLGTPISSANNASKSQLLQNQLGNLNGQGSSNQVDGPSVSTSPNGSPGTGLSPSATSSSSPFTSFATS